MNVAYTRFRNAINRSGTRRHTQHPPGRSHTLARRFLARAKSHDRTTRPCAPVVADTLSLRYGSQSDPRRNHGNPGSSREKSNHAPRPSAFRYVLSSSSFPRSSVRTVGGTLPSSPKSVPNRSVRANMASARSLSALAYHFRYGSIYSGRRLQESPFGTVDEEQAEINSFSS